MEDMRIEYRRTDSLIPYARNPRLNDAAVPKMAGMIKEFGFRVPVIIRSDGSVVDGHLRLKAAAALGMETVPCVLADDLTEQQVKALRLAVNKAAELAEWDRDLLKLELEELQAGDFDMEVLAFDDLEDILGGADADGEDEAPAKSLAERFGYPPFSVLMCRDGAWQDRKRAWIALGIDSGEGRSVNAIGGGMKRIAEKKAAGYYREKRRG